MILFRISFEILQCFFATNFLQQCKRGGGSETEGKHRNSIVGEGGGKLSGGMTAREGGRIFRGGGGGGGYI